MARHKEDKGKKARRAAEQALKAPETSQETRLEAIKWKPDGSHIINFGQLYLPRWFRSASPAFHYEIAKLYNKNLVNIVTSPRGHAKTTFIRTIALYNCITFGRDDLVPQEYQSEYDMFVGKIENVGQASVGAVKYQLDRNHLILQDF